MQPRLLHHNPLPDPNDEPIRRHFAQAGYHIKAQALDRTYRLMLHQLGDSAFLLRSDAVLKVLSDAQVRKETAYPVKVLQQIANPRERTPEFMDHLQRLVALGVFLRGYNLKCPYCEVEDWHPHLSESVLCLSCGSTFQPPLVLNLVYKLNHVFAKGVKNGALTALLLLHRIPDITAWGANYTMNHRGQTYELDLVIIADGRLLVVECKDNVPDHQKLRRQLQNTDAIAHGVKADTLLFATLAKSIPDDVTSILSHATTPAMTLNRHRLTHSTWSFE